MATTSTVVTGYETLNITSNLKLDKQLVQVLMPFTAMTGVQMKNMTIAGAAPVVIVANAGMVNLTSIDLQQQAHNSRKWNNCSINSCSRYCKF